MGSGWVFVRVIQLDILVDKYVPLRGSAHIPLPNFLAKKKVIINVQNNDDECFKWAVASAQNPAKDHVDRSTKYGENAKKLNFAKMSFLTKLKDIHRFIKL
jgi:hypothetical protein